VCVCVCVCVRECVCVCLTILLFHQPLVDVANVGEEVTHCCDLRGEEETNKPPGSSQEHEDVTVGFKEEVKLF